MTRLTTLTAAAVLALVIARAIPTGAAAEQPTVYQHQACADCVVMRVSFVPPKP